MCIKVVKQTPESMNLLETKWSMKPDYTQHLSTPILVNMLGAYVIIILTIMTSYTSIALSVINTEAPLNTSILALNIRVVLGSLP